MNEVIIGGKAIGPGHPCYVIAEAGSNHNRDWNIALKLIDAAVAAGADAVKWQTYSAESMYSKKAPNFEHLKENTWDLIKRIEMPREWHADLARECGDRGVHFLSTPFDLEAVEQLDKVGVPAFKIASFEITHLPLLKACAQTGKPIILSTGMANLADIELALETIEAAGGREVVLLHCAIGYPPKFADINLRAMDTMRQAFAVPVGYSDHTMGLVADVAAVARGACVIEKHYTLSRAMEGPDHPFALEPDELRAMIEAVRQTEEALGSSVKRHTASEEEFHRGARRSLVAACAIAKGTKIEERMLAVKRPGWGIHPRHIPLVVGREARVDIEADDILTWEMV
ncbi:MAG TPA: N-acetylneuraminate synthase family protein [bacterium]|nr:N-acetylneuraminate synthase family protein [bacterium]